MIQDGFIVVGKGLVATRHNNLGCFAGFREFVGAITFVGAAPTKIGNKIALISGAKHIGKYAHYGSGIEHSIDTAFGMVAHDEPDKCFAGFFKSLGIVVPEFYFRIVVFQVGIVGGCAEVAPLPHYGIAEITVVRFVGIGVHDRANDFAAYPASMADGNRPIEFGTHLHDRTRSDGYRPTKHAAFHDHCILSDVNWPVVGIQNAAFHLHALFHKNILGRANNAVGRRNWLALFAGGEQLEVILNSRSIQAGHFP